MKKVLWLTERLPFPPTDGTKSLVYHYFKLLHDDLGLEVVNASFAEKTDDLSLKPDFISKTYILEEPSAKEKLRNLLVHTFIRGLYPMQVSLYWSERNKQKVEQIIREEKPDVVVADLVRTMEYLKDFEGLKLADMQDLFSKRYQQQMQVELDQINPYGAYLFRLPKPVQKILQMKLLKKLVMKSECKRLRKYEKKIALCYDSVFFVAQREADIYNQMTNDSKAVAIPMGVDTDYFSCDGESKPQIPHSIAFLGAMSVAHNESGAVHLARNIFPHVLKKYPDAKLYLIGGGAGEKIRALQSENVIVTGRVDDVRDILMQCQVFACPLLFGSGIKTKNLEAMAMGMPVVTTTVGAENIDAVDGTDWLIADDAQAFADRIIEIMEKPELYQRLSENGRKFVSQCFSWNVAKAGFKRIMKI